MNQDSHGNVAKLGAKIDILKDVPELSCFGTAAEIVKYLQNRGNYHVSVSEQEFSLSWSITGQNYTREMRRIICLKKQEMSKLETL